MIKEAELFEGKRVEYADGAEVTLPFMQGILADIIEQEGIQAVFQQDRIRFGGLIGGDVEDCVVISHPEHKNDYINYVVYVTHQGRHAFVYFHKTGKSKLENHKGNMRKREMEATWYSIMDECVDIIFNGRFALNGGNVVIKR